MVQRIRESLALLLIAFLPLHALLVTVGTKMIAGPGHAPLTMLAMWKEGITLVLCGLVVLEWIFEKYQRFMIAEKFQHDGSTGLTMTRWHFSELSIDWLDTCIIGLFIIASFLSYPPASNPYPLILGFKYTIFPLLIFFIFRRISWSEEFMERAPRIVLSVGIVVALYGILTFFLPMRFFTELGYSDLHSLYLPGSPLAAFQQIGEMGLRRIQSTFSGPNQLGVWLLIPLGILFMRIRSGRRGILEYCLPTVALAEVGITGLLGMALVMTFSRAAWAGAGVMVLWNFLRVIPRYAKPFACHGEPDESIHAKSLAYGIKENVIIFIGILMLFTFSLLFFPGILLRKESTLDHIRRPIEAVRVIMSNPWGLGLGSAGPASNRVSDPCVYLTKGAEISWAKDRPELCVFVGDIQIQPKEPCQCPLLPENWYLQVGVELGVIGFILFVTLVVLLVMRWSAISEQWAVLSFMGVSVAALFLHAWEDSAVAYTVWMLLAAALPVAPRWGRS